MYFLSYVSSAVVAFTKDDLTDLLARSRKNNLSQDITGVLLYKDGSFMQVLEGGEDAVRALHARISRDPRHQGVLTLLQGPLEKRQFPDWSMGFRDLNSDDVRALPGYSEFLNTPLTSAEFSTDPSRCQKLLLTFKRSM